MTIDWEGMRKDWEALKKDWKSIKNDWNFIQREVYPKNRDTKGDTLMNIGDFEKMISSPQNTIEHEKVSKVLEIPKEKPPQNNQIVEGGVKKTAAELGIKEGSLVRAKGGIVGKVKEVRQPSAMSIWDQSGEKVHVILLEGKFEGETVIFDPEELTVIS